MTTETIDFKEMTVGPGLVAISVIDENMGGNTAMMEVDQFREIAAYVRKEASKFKKKKRIKMFESACAFMRRLVIEKPEHGSDIALSTLMVLNCHPVTEMGSGLVGKMNDTIEKEGGCSLFALCTDEQTAWVINGVSNDTVH